MIDFKPLSSYTGCTLGCKGPEAGAFEREVDAILYRTYSLTPDEITTIEDWHAEHRAMLGAGKRGRRIQRRRRRSRIGGQP